MTVEFTLTSAGLDTGPFNLYSNLDGFIIPFEVAISKASLLGGYSSANVPDYTTVVRIQSAGTCGNWIDIILENTTTSTTTGIPTTSSSTSSTSTTIASIPCGTSSSYSGGQSYPSSETVSLGSDTGPVSLEYNALSVPDRYVITFNGSIVLDSGYRGSSSYDFGNANRSAFKSSLLGLVDPVTSNIYPDFTTYPQDGYPRILGLGTGVMIFNKTTTDLFATIDVYGPLPGTAWNYTLNCPNAGPTTTITTTGIPITSTTSTTLIPPTTTTSTTACNCDNYDLYIDTGDFITSFGNTDTNLNAAFFVTFVDCTGNIEEIKVDSGTGLSPDFCCALIDIVPQVTYWQSNVEYTASSYIVLNGNCC